MTFAPQQARHLFEGRRRFPFHERLVGGDEPNGFTAPDESPIYWHAGLHYKLTGAIEDRINADSRLRERIVEKCLATSCD